MGDEFQSFIRVFSTAADNQTQVGVKVLQGEREMRLTISPLGSLSLWITIKSSGGLSEDEIEKLAREAELHAQKDQERKTLIDIRSTDDTTTYSIEKSVNEYRDKIPAEVATEIETAVSDLRKAMAGDNAD
ncbi:hypothetical protein IFM89_031966 [Coptis chinensis]|uniref:Uncharacterized protein n=1 Tax=Coptis chinensis TaxID=261450 RepID=A0A835HFK7_9MAGN|nr:hypothetical protein IFM89_031966 [Coptis chinensis]